jgi:hypothetical protein
MELTETASFGQANILLCLLVLYLILFQIAGQIEACTNHVGVNDVEHMRIYI